MNKKTRVRTIKELFVRKKKFLLICKILDNLKINYFLQTGILLGAIRDNDFFWRNEFKVPSEFLKKLSTINFLGRQFKCPNNPQEYLKYAYGNWRKPLKTSNKALYFSKKFRNNNKYLFISITQIIKKILYFFF